jgi:hypothetical protein
MVMQKANDLLEQDGVILIETWNWRSLTGRVFGKRWHEYSPPTVIHWFSKNSLNRLMEELGFERIAGGRPQKKILGKHAKSLFFYVLRGAWFSISSPKALGIIPDGMAIPYPAEDLFWAAFKKKGV